MSKKTKKQLQTELADIIDAVGSESESKGIKAVQEYHKQEEKDQENKYNNTLDNLDFSKSKNSDYYARRILDEANLQLKDQNPPPKFQFFFSLTSKGLVLWIRDPKSRWHANGMKISQNPLFDAQGIMRLLDKGLEYAEILHRTESEKKGIILP